MSRSLCRFFTLSSHPSLHTLRSIIRSPTTLSRSVRRGTASRYTYTREMSDNFLDSNVLSKLTPYLAYPTRRHVVRSKRSRLLTNERERNAIDYAGGRLIASACIESRETISARRSRPASYHEEERTVGRRQHRRMNMKRVLPFSEPAVRCTYKNAKRPTSGWLRDKLGY